LDEIDEWEIAYKQVYPLDDFINDFYEMGSTHFFKKLSLLPESNFFAQKSSLRDRFLRGDLEGEHNKHLRRIAKKLLLPSTIKRIEKQRRKAIQLEFERSHIDRNTWIENIRKRKKERR
jgi:hypothetical protein